ncbi:coproporphyrinogen III oxidase [Citrobacter koseri]|nr:coproporphyrinogen III oxidase [Citrobacter koseri]
MNGLVRRDRAAVVCDLLFGLPVRMPPCGVKIWR